VATDDTVLKELSNVDENILSMQAAANERNSISYILSDCIHERPVHVGIIQRYLTRRLLEVLPEIIEGLDKIFSDIPTIGSSWAKVDLQNLTTESIFFVTNRVLIGQQLANDEQFLESVLELSRIISSAGILIDLSPSYLKPILARYLVPKRGAFQVYLTKLSTVFEERRKEMKENGGLIDGQVYPPSRDFLCLFDKFNTMTFIIRTMLFNGSSKLHQKEHHCMISVSTSYIFNFPPYIHHPLAWSTLYMT
jgi:hypothetical protein